MKNDQVNSRKINDSIDKVDCNGNLYPAKILTHLCCLFIFFFILFVHPLYIFMLESRG